MPEKLFREFLVTKQAQGVLTLNRKDNHFLKQGMVESKSSFSIINSIFEIKDYSNSYTCYGLKKLFSFIPFLCSK